MIVCVGVFVYVHVCFCANVKVLCTAVTAPTIEEYKEVVHACEGEQVTLKIKVLGFPKPTITWSNSGRVIEASYAIDIEQDGSLTFVSVELQHSGTYHFTATNGGGSVEGTTELVVHAESEREELRTDPKVESKPVVVAKFGDYVSSLHAQNIEGFTSQFWVLIARFMKQSANIIGIFPPHLGLANRREWSHCAGCSECRQPQLESIPQDCCMSVNITSNI